MAALTLSDQKGTLRSFLDNLGYRDDLLEEEFPVWTGSEVVRASVVAFSRSAPHDMSTSAIVGITEGPLTGRNREIARFLAAPFSLYATRDGIELWKIAADPGEDERVLITSYADAREIAGRYASALRPDQLFQAKAIGRQLSLIPIDVRLLTHAQETSGASLVSLVNDAMRIALEGTKKGQKPAFDAASRLVVGAMAALMVRDKLDLHPPGLPSSHDDVLRHAATSFPGHFDWIDKISSPERKRLFDVLDILGTDINYAGLSPSVVSQVYEHAVVSEAARRALGIYYTPPELARRIAGHLPFEDLAPDERVVLDPVCGSGTLLLSAHDRMQEAVPLSWDIFKRHEYVRSHLIGYDVDEFATEIARLALLLNAMPAGNTWQIESRDSTKPLPVTPRPSIILSNPPWMNLRSKNGKRFELADDFVMRMVEALAPGGFLAVVLPATWLSSDVSRDAREFLMERMKIFEIWRLPEMTFGRGSRLDPCVVFAQTAYAGAHQMWRRVFNRSSSLERFFEKGVSDETVLTRTNGNVDLRMRSPLDSYLETLTDFPRLDAIAEIQNGPPPKSATAMRGQGPYRWLRFAEDLCEFGVVPVNKLTAVRYPEEFSKRGRNVEIYLRPKVLVSAKRWADNPWRLKVALDPYGIIPRETLHWVAPREMSGPSVYAILAFLGSSVASAWVDSREPTRNIRVEHLKALPVPDADSAAWNVLHDTGLALVAAAENDDVPTRLTRELESQVFDAYRLPDAVRSHVASHFAGVAAPEGRARFPAEEIAPSTLWESYGPRRAGAVLDVARGGIRLWVSGVTADEGVWMPVPQRFHGWLCRPGATFDVYGAEAGLAGARFDYQARTYQNLEDLTAVR